MPDRDGFGVVERLRRDPAAAPPVVLMLSSESRTEDLARCRAQGVDGYVVKPVRRAQLHEAVAAALGRPRPAAETPGEAGEPAGGAERRLLLVEDSADNRVLIESFLRKGPWRIEVAENGAVAVEKFQRGRYDLVLMDMQMPVMDGYTATRAIRSWEREQGRRATPIIALTANALREEVEKSLNAGCDAHLPKPIRKATLLAAITEFAGSWVS